MARQKKKQDLKTIVEQGIKAVLESSEEPSDGRIKALALGIKMCALNAKLEESEYGDFFTAGDAAAGPGEPGDLPKGKKRPARKREDAGTDSIVGLDLGG
jgi:hypothetical protein